MREMLEKLLFGRGWERGERTPLNNALNEPEYTQRGYYLPLDRQNDGTIIRGNTAGKFMMNREGRELHTLYEALQYEIARESTILPEGN